MTVAVPRTNDEKEVLKWRNGVKKVIANLENLQPYANNAAAIAGGLKVGEFYRTGGDPDLVCVVH